MRKLLYTTALALCLGGTAAHAEMQKIAGAGYWEADAGTATDTNTPMCMIGTGGDGYDFTLKYTRTGLWFDLYRDGWNIPPDMETRVNMWVDSAPGWWINMSPLASGARGHMSGWIDPNVRTTDGRELIGTYILNMLRNGRSLRVGFPQGNTGAWTLSLSGTETVMDPFINCSLALDDKHNNVGQPYGRASNPGQPYGYGNITPKYSYQ